MPEVINQFKVAVLFQIEKKKPWCIYHIRVNLPEASQFLLMQHVVYTLHGVIFFLQVGFMSVWIVQLDLCPDLGNETSKLS